MMTKADTGDDKLIAKQAAAVMCLRAARLSLSGEKPPQLFKGWLSTHHFTNLSEGELP
jgi:hypothetical protein